MKPLILNDILAALDLGEYLMADILIKRVIRSSQEMKDHTLLFHFENTLSDWETDYKEAAVITSRESFIEHKVSQCCTVIRVDDVKKVYYQFLDYYRNLFDLPVIGITGTCGKTTTKEMVKQVLSPNYKLQSTYLSSNGLHRNLSYLMGIEEDTDAAVIEMGVAYPGNVEVSCRYFQPQVGIITTIGIDHLSGCETFENYVKAKAEIIDGIKEDGTLILNGDDANIKKLDLKSFKGKLIYYGVREKCNYRAANIRYGNNGMEFSLWCEGKRYQVFVTGYGEHTVYNALAAIAACHTIGFVDISTACKRLKRFKQVARHLQVHNGIHGSLIIDDTWTVNPTSVESGLSVLENLAEKTGKKKILLLGDLTLLGKYRKEQSIKLANQIVRQKKVDILITLSEAAHYVADKAVELGMKHNKIYRCNSAEEVNKTIHRVINENCIILLKTSSYESPDKIIDGLIL